MYIIFIPIVQDHSCHLKNLIGFLFCFELTENFLGRGG